MADNVQITAGSGTTIRTDDIGSGVQAQYVKLMDGTDASSTVIPGDAAGLRVKGNGFHLTTTLTVTNGVYTIGDVVGGLITLANAVSANGKHLLINTITLSGVVAIPYQLRLYNADLATPTQADNAVFTVVAADGLKFLGCVTIAAGDYVANAAATFNDATVAGTGLEVGAGASVTSLYAYLVAVAVTSPGTTTIYLTVTGEMID